MKIYCQKCGFANEYRIYKPKFCSSCGTTMSFEGKAHAAEPKELPEKLEASENQNDFVPLLNKLDFDFDVSDTKPRTLKLSDVAGTAEAGFSNEPRGPDPEISDEDFLAEFKRSAGSKKGDDAKEKES